MKTINEKKLKEKTVTTTSDRPEQVRQKAAGAATNESSVAAELKNREHGNEQPGR